jgi:hypothetical protein
MELGVTDHLEDLFDVIALTDGAGGAPKGALAAVDAGDVVLDRQFVKPLDALDALAGLGTLTTEDAFAVIADNGGVVGIDGHAPTHLNRPGTGGIILLRGPALATDRFSGILAPR